MDDTVGAELLGFDGLDLDARQTRACTMLYRSLNIGRVVAFVGSGISRSFQISSWDGLIKRLRGDDPKASVDEFDERVIGRAEKNLLDLETLNSAVTREQPSLHAQAASIIRQEESKRNIALAPNPIRAIVEKLKITRFLTTNYDHLIAKELQNSRLQDTKDLPCYALGDPGFADSLRLFACRSAGFTRGVIHLHGKYENPDSLILTEKDYQHAYLGDTMESRQYRDALMLAFSANAILFLGSSLQESDVLRPLRQFLTQRAIGRREQQLFALIGVKNEDRSNKDLLWRFLQSRYGVKAIFYDVTKDEKHHEDFCKQLTTLADGWQEWWSRWQMKPLIRKPMFRTKGTKMVHHQVDESWTGRPRDIKRVDEELENKSVVVVLGRTGTGKGTLGLKLADRELEPRGFQKSFFATLHFSNEFLSMLESIIQHLAPKTCRTPKWILDECEEVLLDDRVNALVVIGGIERLLRVVEPTVLDDGQVPANVRLDVPDRYPLPVGQPISREVSRFFEIVASVSKKKLDKDKKGVRLILTSSILPQPLFNEEQKIETIGRVRVSGVDFTEGIMPAAEAASLHGALRGHAYASTIVSSAYETKKTADPDHAKAWLRSLASRLTGLTYERRPLAALSAACSALLDPSEAEVLELVSLFSTPVSGNVIRVLTKGEAPIAKLLQKKLLLSIGPDGRDQRYTAHSLVRAYVQHEKGASPASTGEPHRLELSGIWRSLDEDFTGSVPGHGETVRALDALLFHMEASAATGAIDSDFVRAAFGLIRARWTATCISRLQNEAEDAAAQDDDMRELESDAPHYDAYQKRLSRLLNCIRDRANFWDREYEKREKSQSESAHLYVDELAWVYNELGLATYCIGNMDDAWAIFRLGQDVNNFAEYPSHEYRWCHSQIHLGVVAIERGFIAEAINHFDYADWAARKISDDDSRAAIAGFLGLARHLGGAYEEAQKLYEYAVKECGKRGNRRGSSIFARHYSDLLRLRGDRKRAQDLLQQSIAAAEAGRHRDQLQHGRIAQANLLRSENRKLRESVSLTIDPLEFAKRMGLRRLEADALKVRAHFAIDQGELELADQLITRCLAIVTLHGMRLRRTAALVTMGTVARHRGHHDMAQKILKSALEDATNQGYQLQVELAHAELARL